MKITDARERCAICGFEQPVGAMTMNDAEGWECDDVRSCATRLVPADEQIRAYLDANPDAFAQFLHREERRDPTWFRTYLRKQARIMGRGWL